MFPKPVGRGSHRGFCLSGLGEIERHDEQIIVRPERFGHCIRVAAGGDHGMASCEGCFGDVDAHAAARASDEPGLLLSHGFGVSSTCEPLKSVPRRSRLWAAVHREHVQLNRTSEP